MTKRILAYAGSVLLALIGVAIAIAVAYMPSEIRLTEEQIRTVIEDQLPFERDGVMISTATVRLGDDDVSIAVAVAGQRLGQSFSLSAATSGQPRYRNGSFYFTPDTITFSDMVVGEAGSQTVTARLRSAADRYITDPGLQNLVSDLSPALQSWLQTRIMTAVGNVLSRTPVYTLPNDTTGIAAKAVLNQVFVDNNELVITFTLWRLTGWVIMGLMMLITAIGMLIVFWRHPGLFMAISILPGGD